MKDFNEFQNKAFSGIFDELKKQANPKYKGDALTLLHLNDENFIKTFADTTELTGDAEDIELCNKRAEHLGLSY